MIKRIYDQGITTRRAVSDIIFAYRQVHSSTYHNLSFRQLAAHINEEIRGKHNAISYQTLKNWEDRLHIPRVYTLYRIALIANGWVSDLAYDLLSALRPDKYQPATFIGKRALERSLIDTGPLKNRYDQHYRGSNLSGD
jgi:hypothetical protein